MRDLEARGRSPVRARHAMVATPNPLATQAAIAMLARGGRTRILAFNGSGRAPAAADAVQARGWQAMPATGPRAVTVPGVVEAWARLAVAHGTRGLDELLQPAIDYAEHGYPVGDVIAAQ